MAPVGDKKPFTESESVGGPISLEVDSEISVDGAISLPVKVEGPGRSLSNSGQCPLSLIVPWYSTHPVVQVRLRALPLNRGRHPRPKP